MPIQLNVISPYQKMNSILLSIRFLVDSSYKKFIPNYYYYIFNFVN